MNKTNHIKQRYVERILNINNSVEVKQYIVDNNDKVESDLDKLMEFSQCIGTAQINGDKTSKNYHLRDNIIIVTDTDNSTMITLYKVDFGFPDRTNRVIVDDLMKDISELDELLEETNKGINEYIGQKELEIDNYDAEILNLKQRIEIITQKKNVAVDAVKAKRLDNDYIRKQREDYMNKLCNSLALKKDLEKLNK